MWCVFWIGLELVAIILLQLCTVLVHGRPFLKPSAFYPLEESESSLFLLRKDKNRIWVIEGPVRNASWRYPFLMESSQSNVLSPFWFFKHFKRRGFVAPCPPLRRGRVVDFRGEVGTSYSCRKIGSPLIHEGHSMLVWCLFALSLMVNSTLLHFLEHNKESLKFNLDSRALDWKVFLLCVVLFFKDFSVLTWLFWNCWPGWPPAHRDSPAYSSHVDRKVLRWASWDAKDPKYEAFWQTVETINAEAKCSM